MKRGTCIAWSNHPQRCKELAKALDFESRIFDGAKDLSSIGKVFRYLKNFVLTISVLRRVDNLVIQSPPWLTLWATIFAPRLRIIIVDAHPSAFGHFEQFKSKILLFLTPRFLIRKVDLFLVANRQDLESLYKLNARCVVTFGEAIDQEFERIESGQNRVLIALSGNGDEPIRELIGRIGQYSGEIVFRITGNFEKGDLEKLQVLEKSGKIELLGYLDHEEFRKELRMARVTLCLSKSRVTRMRVAIEATLCGSVVVVSDNESMRDELPFALFADANLNDFDTMVSEALKVTLEDSDLASHHLVNKNKERIDFLRRIVSD